eukprot:gene16229-18864_t
MKVVQEQVEDKHVREVHGGPRIKMQSLDTWMYSGGLHAIDVIRTETLTALLEHADTLCLSAIELVQGVMDRLVDDALAIPVILTNKVSPYGSDADAAVVLDTAPSSVDVVGSARRDETETAASAPRFADYFEASFKSNGFGSGVEEAWTTGTGTTPDHDLSGDLLTQPVQPLAFEQADADFKNAAAAKRSYVRGGGGGQRRASLQQQQEEQEQEQQEQPGTRSSPLSPGEQRLGEILAASGNSSPMSGIHPLDGEGEGGLEQEIGNFVVDDDGNFDDWADIGSDGENDDADLAMAAGAGAAGAVAAGGVGGISMAAVGTSTPMSQLAGVGGTAAAAGSPASLASLSPLDSVVSVRSDGAIDEDGNRVYATGRRKHRGPIVDKATELSDRVMAVQADPDYRAPHNVTRFALDATHTSAAEKSRQSARARRLETAAAGSTAATKADSDTGVSGGTSAAASDSDDAAAAEEEEEEEEEEDADDVKASYSFFQSKTMIRTREPTAAMLVPPTKARWQSKYIFSAKLLNTASSKQHVFRGGTGRRGVKLPSLPTVIDAWTEFMQKTCPQGSFVRKNEPADSVYNGLLSPADPVATPGNGVAGGGASFESPMSDAATPTPFSPGTGTAFAQSPLLSPTTPAATGASTSPVKSIHSSSPSSLKGAGAGKQLSPRRLLGDGGAGDAGAALDDLSILETTFQPADNEFYTQASPDAALALEMKSFYWHMHELCDEQQELEFFTAIIPPTSSKTVAACAFSNLLHLLNSGAVSVDQKSSSEMWEVLEDDEEQDADDAVSANAKDTEHMDVLLA